MLARTALLLENFSSKIGLSLPPETKERTGARLVLSEKWSVQFEEEREGEHLWIYIPLLTEMTALALNPITELLRLLFLYHRSSDARVIVDPESQQLLLASKFIISSLDDEVTLVHALEEQVRSVVRLAQELAPVLT